MISLKTKPKVLIIEDDSVLSQVVSRNVRNWGYGTEIIANGEVGLNFALNKGFSLVISDISLPGLNGLQIVEKLRSKGVKVPIILVTNFMQKDNELFAYKVGASIFHKKPLDYDLLKAQIKMLIENHRYTTQLKLGDLVIDPEKHIVQKNGSVIELSKKEFDLLLILASSPGEVFTRKEVIELTNLNIKNLEESSVDTLVSRVRSKLGKYKNEDIIETVFKSGYRLNRIYLE